jgi:hypothetical protein
MPFWLADDWPPSLGRVPISCLNGAVGDGGPLVVATGPLAAACRVPSRDTVADAATTSATQVDEAESHTVFTPGIARTRPASLGAKSSSTTVGSNAAVGGSVITNVSVLAAPRLTRTRRGAGRDIRRRVRGLKHEGAGIGVRRSTPTPPTTDRPALTHRDKRP